MQIYYQYSRTWCNESTAGPWGFNQALVQLMHLIICLSIWFLGGSQPNGRRRCTHSTKSIRKRLQRVPKTFSKTISRGVWLYLEFYYIVYNSMTDRYKIYSLYSCVCPLNLKPLNPPAKPSYALPLQVLGDKSLTDELMVLQNEGREPKRVKCEVKCED